MRRGVALWAAVVITGALAVAVPPSTAVADPAPPAPTQSAERCQALGRGASLNEGFAREAQSLPSSGVAVVQTLYVDFSDAVGTAGEIADTESAMAQSAALIDEESGGRLTLDRRSLPAWHRLPGLSTAYDQSRITTLYKDAVALVDADVDFSDVDVVWVVWKTSAPDDATRAQAWNNSDLVVDGRALNRAVVFHPEEVTGPGEEWTPVHETGHTLGLPDLYDSVDANDPALANRWTGGWDVMGDYYSHQGRTLFGWHQWRLSWLADADVACVRPGEVADVSLAPVESASGERLALVRLDGTRVLAVESRRAQGWDAGIPVEGALVYTIDTTRSTGDGPVTVQFADGRDPATRDSDTLAGAPLQPGDTFTDADSGVRVSVTSASDGGDQIVVDARSLERVVAPKKTIAYYQTMTIDGQYISPKDLLTHDTGVSVVNLAAFHLNPGALLLNDDPPGDARFERLWKDLADMQAGGIRVVAMVGGAENVSWETLTTDFDVQYARLRDLIVDHQLDGVDLDVETETDNPVVVAVIDALRRDFGPSFLITLSPVSDGLQNETDPLTGLDYNELYRDRGDDIDWFNIQFYCGWGDPTKDEYLTTVAFQAGAGGGGIPPEKLVMAAITTPDRCPYQRGWIGLDGLQEQVRQIVAAEPRFGGVAGWEYAGSLPGGAAASWQWYALMTDAMRARPVDPAKPVLPATGAGPVWPMGVAAAGLLAAGALSLALGARRRRVR